jgi:hypothetical protein
MMTKLLEVRDRATFIDRRQPDLPTEVRITPTDSPRGWTVGEYFVGEHARFGEAKAPQWFADIGEAKAYAWTIEGRQT